MKWRRFQISHRTEEQSGPYFALEMVWWELRCPNLGCWKALSAASGRQRFGLPKKKMLKVTTPSIFWRYWNLQWLWFLVFNIFLQVLLFAIQKYLWKGRQQCYRVFRCQSVSKFWHLLMGFTCNLILRIFWAEPVGKSTLYYLCTQWHRKRIFEQVLQVGTGVGCKKVIFLRGLLRKSWSGLPQLRYK